MKLTGDGMLVEFPSVVNAVACAVEIQRRMGERNRDVPQDQGIEFRIGVNLGDIIPRRPPQGGSAGVMLPYVLSETRRRSGNGTFRKRHQSRMTTAH